MGRYDLTDFEWRVIAPLLANKPRGVPRVDDRRVLSGILWGIIYKSANSIRSSEFIEFESKEVTDPINKRCAD